MGAPANGRLRYLEAGRAKNTHGAAQNRRENAKAANHLLGAPSFSPYQLGVS